MHSCLPFPVGAILHLPGCNMNLRALYATVSLLGLLAEISLFVVLLVRRQYKSFPIFTLCIACNLLSDIGVGILIVAAPAHVGRSVSLGLLPLQYLLDLAVLLEISWHVLRPVYTSLPRGSIAVFATAMTLAVL